LLTQLLLRLDQFDQNVTRAIDSSPDIKTIYDSVCLAFEINRDKPGWEKELYDKLTDYRSKSHKLIYNLPQSDADIDDYEKNRSKIINYFCENLGIDSQTIVHLGFSADGFEKYMGQAITQIADPILRNDLTNTRFHNWNSLDELILGYFGIGYPGETEFDFSIKNSAMRKLLLMINYQKERILWGENIQKDNILFDSLFEMLFEDRYHSIDLGNDTVLKKFRFRPDINIELVLPNDNKIHLNDLNPIIYSTSRIKNPLSCLRKRLERAGENDERSDVTGRMLVLDEEDFWTKFIKQYPLLAKDKDKILEQWSRKVISEILSIMTDKIRAAGYSYKVDKIRESGSLKGLSGVSCNPLKISKSSDDSLFSWYKFVEFAANSMSGYLQEMQIFPSVRDAHRKIADDRRYDLERLFASFEQGSKERRFPLMLVLYGVQGILYEEVVKRRFLNNNHT
jgi:hypothetical protein